MISLRRRGWLGGFTLLEIVVVLAIVAVLTVFAVPYISGMMREAAMRAPVEELQDLAKTVRLRAIKERLPYEIVFTEDGFTGRVFKLHDDSEEEEEPQNEDKEKPLDLAEEDPAEAEKGEEEKPTPPPEPLVEYRFAPGMSCRLLFWGKSQWVEPGPQGRRSEPGQDRWVFQPSGLCSPLRVQFINGAAWIEVAFNPLTADMQDERHYFPE